MNRLFRFTCSPGHNGPAKKNNGCFSKEKTAPMAGRALARRATRTPCMRRTLLVVDLLRHSLRAAVAAVRATAVRCRLEYNCNLRKLMHSVQGYSHEISERLSS